jgi:isoquinoline 1-oxidoreductase beta subunit
MFGMKPEQVKVTTTMLGGGFGRRFGLDMVIDSAEIAKAAGVPVKLVYAREDDIKGHFYRPAAYVRLLGALDDRGNPSAVKMHTVCSSIAQAAGFPLDKGLDSFAVEGLKEWPYDTPNVRVEWSQSEAPLGVWFWRSVGHSQNIFFAESLIDEMAAAAGKDPFEYRRALLGKAPRYRGALELAAEKAGWGKPLPAGVSRGIAVGQSFGSFVAQVVEASVDKDGQVTLRRVVCAVDCGLTANPDIVKRQMESALVFGLGAALHGKITVKDGRIEQSNFDSYPVPRIGEVPPVEVHIVPSSEAPGGVGEPGLTPLAPALTNAIFAATGVRVRKLPIDPEALKRA